MSEVNMEMAKNVYESVCATLDGMELNYERHDDDLVVLFGHRGKDMNHDLLIAVNAKQEAIQLMERLPFSVDSSRAAEISSAICLVNSRLLSGKFTYELEDRISFEVTQIFSGSLIGEETIKRMILALVFTVEDYDDKFMALSKGYLNVEDFKK